MDEVELDETAPSSGRRRVAVRGIDRYQPIADPPTVIVFLKSGNSFVCTRESFDRSGLTLNG
jgi:hypothetical protein